MVNKDIFIFQPILLFCDSNNVPSRWLLYRGSDPTSTIINVIKYPGFDEHLTI